MFIWFQKAAVTVDDHDPLKQSLMEMSWKAAKDLERASAAVRNSLASMNGDREVPMEEFQHRILSRRAMVGQSELNIANPAGPGNNDIDTVRHNGNPDMSGTRIGGCNTA